MRWHIGCRESKAASGRKANNTGYDKEIPMKLTRVIFLALAFIIPTATTSLASAEDAPAAAGETEKPAKKGKKAKKGGKKDKVEKTEEAK